MEDETKKPTETEQTETPKKQLDPICPYCSADPLSITIRDIGFPNGVIAMIAFCANRACRKVLPAAFKGMMRSPIAGPGGGRIIH